MNYTYGSLPLKTDPSIGSFGNAKFSFDLISLKPISIGTIDPPVFQKDCAIAIGQYAGFYAQDSCAIAIGDFAGHTSQGSDSIAIGSQSGELNQGTNAIAIGSLAGQSGQHSNSIIINASGLTLNSQNADACYIAPLRNVTASSVVYYDTSSKEISYGSAPAQITSGNAWAQYLYWNTNTSKWDVGSNEIHLGTNAGQNLQGSYGIAVGSSAGQNNQSSGSVAIGYQAGQVVQGTNVVAVGVQAGQSVQSSGSVAIGFQAGQTNQGNNAIAIGSLAGQSNQNSNSIIINATNSSLNSQNADACYIAPLRNVTASSVVYYDASSKEISYGSVPGSNNIIGTCTTTDSTNTTILTLTPSTNSTTSYNSVVLGNKRGESAGSSYQIVGSFVNNSGTVYQIGSTTTLVSNESIPVTDSNYVISGSNVLLQVTGTSTPAEISPSPVPSPTGSTWTVGTGQTFTDIATALANSSVVNGDRLLLSAEIFLQTSTLTITKSVIIQGNGINSTFIDSEYTYYAPTPLIAMNVSNIVLRDLTVRHRRKQNTSVETAIQIMAANNGTSPGSSGHYLENVIVEYMEFGAVVRSDGWQINNCQFNYVGANNSTRRAVTLYRSAVQGILSNCTYDSGMGKIYDSGTSSGSNTTLSLNDTSKSWVPNEWEGYTLSITGGTGSGQTKTITASQFTATGGSANTVTTTASWTTDQWVGYTVSIVSGTGSGQTRTISANNTTGTLTVSSNWTTNPVSSSIFRISSNNTTQLYINSAWTTIPDNTSTYTITNTGNTRFLSVTSTTATSEEIFGGYLRMSNITTSVPGQTIQQLMNVDTFGVAPTKLTLEIDNCVTNETSAFVVFVLPNTQPPMTKINSILLKNNTLTNVHGKGLFAITGSINGVNASTVNTITCTSATMTPNLFVGNYVTIVSGTGSAQTRTIVANTITTLTVYPNWTITPDTTSTFTISLLPSPGNSSVYAVSNTLTSTSFTAPFVSGVLNSSSAIIGATIGYDITFWSNPNQIVSTTSNIWDWKASVSATNT